MRGLIRLALLFPAILFAAEAAAAERPDVQREEDGILGAFARAASWFLDEDPDRKWGATPLVSVGPDEGFGGGFKVREIDALVPGQMADFQALLTSNEFFDIETMVAAPDVGGSRISLTATLGYHRHPRLKFFGIGNETKLHDKTSYSRERTEAGLRAGVEIAPDLSVEVGLRFQNVNTGDGEDDEIDPIGARYSSATLTGLGSDGLTNSVSARLVYDTMSPRLNPWRGGRVALGIESFGPALGDRDFLFNRYTLEAAYVFPLVPERLALGVRGLFVAEDGARGRTPFYELAYAGDGATLRGFFERRFVDRAALVLNAELRFPIAGHFSGAVFVDAGRVFERASQVTIEDLHVDGGVGVRFVMHPSILVRLDLARSDEDTTVVLAWGQLF